MQQIDTFTRADTQRRAQAGMQKAEGTGRPRTGDNKTVTDAVAEAFESGGFHGYFR